MLRIANEDMTTDNRLTEKMTSAKVMVSVNRQ